MTKFKLKSRDFLGTPTGKRQFNEQLFTAIAPDYASMTRVLSFDRDRAWKRQLIARLPDCTATPQCLDLACGNGDLTMLLAQKYPGAQITGLDLTPAMLNQARHRAISIPNLHWLQGDMINTALPHATFDVVTTGYGLRNAPDLNKALTEIVRLLKPNGLAAILEFSKFDQPWLAHAELAALNLWGGTWGWLRNRNPDAYAYIARSLAIFPHRTELHQKLSDHGLRIVWKKRFFFGIIEALIMQKNDEV